MKKGRVKRNNKKKKLQNDKSNTTQSDGQINGKQKN